MGQDRDCRGGGRKGTQHPSAPDHIYCKWCNTLHDKTGPGWYLPFHTFGQEGDK